MAPRRGPKTSLPDLRTITNEQLRTQIQLVELLRELVAAADLSYEQISGRTIETGRTGEGGVPVGTISKLLNNWEEPSWLGGTTAQLEMLVRALRPTAEQAANFRVLLGLAIHGSEAAEQAAEQLRAWKSTAQEVGCNAWRMDEFTPQDAEVHTAVGRRQTTTPGVDPSDSTPPAYVHRIHDDRLNSLVDQAAAGTLRRVILLEGTSSTGKTRSLFEAVRRLGRDWKVLAPRDPAALVSLVGRRIQLLGAPTVLWLNELQRFFAAAGQGLSTRLLEDLCTTLQPVVIVGTIWPDKYPKPGEDQYRESIAVLDQHRKWTTVVEVSSFTRDEITAARAKADNDPRIQRALRDPDNVGFTETLAGAGELLHLYRSTKGTFTRDLLDAAGDVRRLGLNRLVTAALLLEMARSLWRQRNNSRMPTPTWIDAISTASAPIRSHTGVQALIPVDDTQSGEGFQLADYLEQHIAYTRRYEAILDDEWRALTRHGALSFYNLQVLAERANVRARFSVVEDIWNSAIEAGHPLALVRKSEWLAQQPDRTDDTEAAWAAAAATGHLDALMARARWLAEQPDRTDDTDAAWAAAATTGETSALVARARWLAEQPDRTDEAVAAWAAAATTGETSALVARARWLAEQPDRTDEAVAAWAAAATTGETSVLVARARWLETQPDRTDEAVAAWAAAATTGDPSALVARARWLETQPDRTDDTDAAWAAAATTGETSVLVARARWLETQPDRTDDTDAAWADAATTGNPSALMERALWLAQQPDRTDDTDAAWADATTTGESYVLVERARWLETQPDRTDDTDAAWAAAATTGNPSVLMERALWLAQQPDRTDDTDAAWADAAATGNPYALMARARWLDTQPDRTDDTDAAWADAATTGEPYVLVERARWLDAQPDRTDEAVAAWADAATGDPSALMARARWLAEQPDRTDDTDAAWAAAAATATGPPSILVERARWLAQQPNRTDDTDAAWAAAATTGKVSILVARARWLAQQPDRTDDAVAAWADAAATATATATATGNPSILVERARWLDWQPDRTDDTDAAWADAAATGDLTALLARARWLAEQLDRTDDTEAAWAAVAATGNAQALAERAQWLDWHKGLANETAWEAAESAWRRDVVAGFHDAFWNLSVFLLGRPGRELEGKWISRVGLDAFGNTPPIPAGWDPAT